MRWLFGGLCFKDINVSKDSGVSAKQLNGYLSVYFQDTYGQFAVYYTAINDGEREKGFIDV